MIHRTRTLDDVRPLTNAERLALYRLKSDRAEITNHFRRRYEFGVGYKRALLAGAPHRATGVRVNDKDQNVIPLRRDSA